MPVPPCHHCKRTGFLTDRALALHISQCPSRQSNTQATLERLGKRKAAVPPASTLASPLIPLIKKPRKMNLTLKIKKPAQDVPPVGVAGPSLQHERDDELGPAEDIDNLLSPVGTPVQAAMDADRLVIEPPPVHLPPPLFEQDVGPLDRSARIRRVPKRLHDMIPSAAPRVLETQLPQQLRVHLPAPVAPSSQAPALSTSSTPSGEDSDVEVIDLTITSTYANEFGLYRIYRSTPTHDPDDLITVDNLADSPHFASEPTTAPRCPDAVFGLPREPDDQAAPPAAPWFAPHPNASVANLMAWQHCGATKTTAGLQDMVDTVINQNDFEKDHFRGFSAQKEVARLDQYIAQQNDAAESATPSSDLPWTSAASGWHISSLFIPVPCTGVKQLETDEDRPYQ